jgi:hypothetical protein
MATVLDVAREAPALTLEECDQFLFRRTLTKTNRARLRRLGRYPQVLQDGHNRIVLRSALDAYLASLQPAEKPQMSEAGRKAIGRRLVEGRRKKRAEREAAAAAAAESAGSVEVLLS